MTVLSPAGDSSPRRKPAGRLSGAIQRERATKMTDENTATEVVTYGQALAKTLQAFDTLKKKAGWFERLLIRLLRVTYRQRLRSIVELVPAEITNQIFEATDTSEQNGR